MEIIYFYGIPIVFVLAVIGLRIYDATGTENRITTGNSFEIFLVSLLSAMLWPVVLGISVLFGFVKGVHWVVDWFDADKVKRFWNWVGDV